MSNTIRLRNGTKPGIPELSRGNRPRGGRLGFRSNIEKRKFKIIANFHP